MEEGLRAKGLRWTDSAAAKFAAAVSDEARRKLMATEAEATSLAIPPKPAPLAAVPRGGGGLWLAGLWSGAVTSEGVEKSPPWRTCVVAADAARRGWLFSESPSGGGSLRGGSMSTCMPPCMRAAPSSVPSNAASARASASLLAAELIAANRLPGARALAREGVTRGTPKFYFQKPYFSSNE